MQAIQATLTFETSSPINKDKFTRQNRIVWDHLQHSTITCFIAIDKYDIYHLHSRISELRNKHKKVIYGRTINSRGTTCQEYSLKPFES